MVKCLSKRYVEKRLQFGLDQQKLFLALQNFINKHFQGVFCWSQVQLKLASSSVISSFKGTNPSS